MLEYINLISFVIFIFTASFFVYELRNFLKDYKKGKIKLPGFSESQYQKKQITSATPLKVKKEKVKRANLKLALVGIGGIIIVSGFSLLTLNSAQRSSAKGETKPVVKEVESKGIEIFDLNWKRLTPKEISSLKPGDKIYIGINNPDPLDIDKARIKVNEFIWKEKHETKNYNKEKNVFYIEYKIPSDEARLLIEAQLHSKTNGWLVD